MKIAVLSDIHGNYLALERVLVEIKKLEVSHIFVLGDFVGYYYHPEKVFKLLEEFTTDFIKGNHEDMMLDVMNNSDKKDAVFRKYGSGINFAINKLNPGLIEKICAMPTKKYVEIGGLKFELCHGSPWANDYYIYPDAQEKVLHACAKSGCDFIFMGHTHYPFVYSTNSSVIANVGSVGQARDQGGVASWALVDTTNRSLIFKKTTYEVSELLTEVKRIDPHVPYLFDILKR